MKKKLERKVYERPGIIYEKEIETLAGFCDTSAAPLGGCRTEGICDRPYTD